jgi:hypothetical protein
LEPFLSFAKQRCADHLAIEVEKVKQKEDQGIGVARIRAVWIRLNDVFPSGRTPENSSSKYACLAGRADTAAAIGGYLCVQSRPVRVSSCAFQRSKRACMRSPSYLISCSHSGPCGALSTSLQSCGFTHLGNSVASARGRSVFDFAMTLTRSVDIYSSNCPGRINMPRASWRGHLRLSLVSFPIYFSPATARAKPIRLHQVWQLSPAGNAVEPPPRTENRTLPTYARRCLTQMASRIARNRWAPFPGSGSSLTIRPPARGNRERRNRPGIRV